MSSSPSPVPAAPDAAAESAAQSARHSAQSDAAPGAAGSKVGAGGIAALCNAVERVACQTNVSARAAEGGAWKESVPRTGEIRFEPSGPSRSPLRASAQQDNTGGSAGDDDSLATRVNASGFVDAVIPRRRGNEKKVVLTRALLESYHHESLDSVTEHLGLSKTTIKAACRKLGLARWPFQHTGQRKRRMGVPKQELQTAESAHERALKDTFHQLMDKRQRFGEGHMAPHVTLGIPFTSPPLPTMAGLQAMQSLSALSAMATFNNASGHNFGHNNVPGHNFSHHAPGHNFGLNNVPGQNLTLNNVAGQNLTLNNAAGQNLTLNNAAGQNFGLNNAAGQNLTLTNASGQTFAPNAAFQGSAFQGQALPGHTLTSLAPVQAPLPSVVPYFGANYGSGNNGGMPDFFGGFQTWGGSGGFNLQ
jgi:hypothetical protein